MDNTGPVVSSHGLDTIGLYNLGKAHWNLPAPLLYEAALRRNEGLVASGGAFVAYTGQHTGRSPNDKFIVEEPSSQADIWWGNVNRPMSPEAFDGLLRKARAYLQNREAFVQDLWAGADPEHRLNVRVITENAWHNLFARNMFIRPPAEALQSFEPEFTVLQLPGLQADPEVDGTNSECFVLVNFAQRLVLIGGTWYAGEIKKSIFSVLNYLLPARDVLPMHCSANVGPKGDTAIFFGLSGTGKTTLSADPSRNLIGDDEHGWTNSGVFNFEGGCYAKVIKLSAEAEPEIWATTRRFGTILENVALDPATRELDLDDGRFTENTRASYPLDFIPNIVPEGVGGLPQNIVMLTADAFGVLPPISELSPEQAMYHFLSGYTARVAGTEKGLGNEPQATFSTCFGGPFMPRHPSVYARMLGEKMAKTGARCWLVNTGWTGGQYGVGQRMSIRHTRAMLRAALDGSLAGVESVVHPQFGLRVPTACPEVPAEVLDPRRTWQDAAAYDSTAHELTKRFEQNFKQFEAYVDDPVKAAGIYAKAA
ncbi:phosphoenolpyruvate carboxykinase [Aquibaculum arenosum]|uniref:Phosphoenolpyruvate carboxykinase (ATP) n=1 Tax=Aquibaculum arenosum TaxID=3032591 RepID=A0ABT5YLS8_9PROT|nr:phosphoenolpyruvate carboxykinase [Fodinicurvata sp. CAU 1616]MDF2095901.1 phosphoenolpyruvate carboxykinase [Fodinicurvata sp. CAU 1616]